MNQKDADDWYEFEPINLPMSKKKRIALLEKQVADLQARLAALEAKQSSTSQIVLKDLVISPTEGPIDFVQWLPTSAPVDLTPNVTC